MPSELDADAQNFISKLTDRDPEQRFTITQAATHPFVPVGEAQMPMGDSFDCL